MFTGILTPDLHSQDLIIQNLKRGESGRMEFLAQGQGGQAMVVEQSRNLKDWLPVEVRYSETGELDFAEPADWGRQDRPGDSDRLYALRHVFEPGERFVDALDVVDHPATATDFDLEQHLDLFIGPLVNGHHDSRVRPDREIVFLEVVAKIDDGARVATLERFEIAQVENEVPNAGFAGPL